MASSKNTNDRKRDARFFTVKFGPTFQMNEKLAEIKAMNPGGRWKGALAFAIEHWTLMTASERGAAVMRVVEHRSAPERNGVLQGPALPNGWKFHSVNDQAAA